MTTDVETVQKRQSKESVLASASADSQHTTFPRVITPDQVLRIIEYAEKTPGIKRGNGNGTDYCVFMRHQLEMGIDPGHYIMYAQRLFAQFPEAERRIALGI